MFTMPENQHLKDLAEPQTGLTALEEHLQGSAYSEQTVMIQLEPNVIFQAVADNEMAAPDHHQLWTAGIEKSAEVTEQNVDVPVPDVRYPISPAAEVTNEQQGCDSPIKSLPFVEHKNKNEEMVTGDQYSLIGTHSDGSDLTVAPEPDKGFKQEVAVTKHARVSDHTHERGVFEFDLTESGGRKDTCGQDNNGQNCFICSACGQSFDSFSSFQMHRCKNITEVYFGCQICGKTFNQMSILKLHLDLHVE